MKTHFKLFATFALAIGVNYSAFSQSWDLTGNVVTPGQYLGSQNNQPLDVKTDNTHRLRIMPSGTTTINNYLIDHDGFVGLSTNPNFTSNGNGTTVISPDPMDPNVLEIMKG